MWRRFAFLVSLVAAVAASPLAAQEEDVPYWASIRASVVNMRVGPATTYRIDWVYKRVGLPLKVVRKKEGWRLVEDPDGARGWMLGRFLSRDRYVFVTGKGNADLRADARESARILWKVEPGVTGKLSDCDAGWCEIDIAGHRGFVRQDRLWGPGKP